MYEIKINSESYGQPDEANRYNHYAGPDKGQKRNARPKASGVAASKRLATKRNNIRKHG